MSWLLYKTSHKKVFDQREKHSVITETHRAVKSGDAGFPDFPSGIATAAAFDRSMSKSRGEAIYTESFYTNFPTTGALSVRANVTEETLETHPKFGTKGTNKIEDTEWLNYRKYLDGEQGWKPENGTANFQIFWNLKKKGIDGYLSCNIEAQVTIFQNQAADSSKVGQIVSNSVLPTLSDNKNWILFAVNGQKEGAKGVWKNTYVFKASGAGGWEPDLYKSGSLSLTSSSSPSSESGTVPTWKLVQTDKRYDDRQGQDLVTDYYEATSSVLPKEKSPANGAFDRILEYADGLAKYQESYYVGNTDSLDGFTYNTTLSQEPLETHPRYRTGGDKAIPDTEWQKYRAWQDDPSSTVWNPSDAIPNFKDFWTKKSKGIDSWLDYGIEAQVTDIDTSTPAFDECGRIATLPSPRAITLKSGRTWLLVAIDAEKITSGSGSITWRVTKTFRSSSDGGWEPLIYTLT